MVFNEKSYYINEHRGILIKNKDILQILKSYKVKTYDGRPQKVHFKDIYTILVRRVFEENAEDFEISKYLKTKMKNQWYDKHKRMRDFSKSSFKLH